MLSIQMWLHILYEYEMLVYDLGCVRLDRYTKALNDYWETF